MGLSAQSTCDMLMAAADKYKQELISKEDKIRELRDTILYRDQAIYALKYSGKSMFRKSRIQAMKINRKIRNGAGFKSFFSSL